jgi:hypothetical protein
MTKEVKVSNYHVQGKIYVGDLNAPINVNRFVSAVSSAQAKTYAERDHKGRYLGKIVDFVYEEVEGSERVRQPKHYNKKEEEVKMLNNVLTQKFSTVINGVSTPIVLVLSRNQKNKWVAEGSVTIENKPDTRTIFIWDTKKYNVPMLKRGGKMVPKDYLASEQQFFVRILKEAKELRKQSKPTTRKNTTAMVLENGFEPVDFEC